MRSICWEHTSIPVSSADSFGIIPIAVWQGFLSMGIPTRSIGGRAITGLVSESLQRFNSPCPKAFGRCSLAFEL